MTFSANGIWGQTHETVAPIMLKPIAVNSLKTQAPNAGSIIDSFQRGKFENHTQVQVVIGLHEVIVPAKYLGNKYLGNKIGRDGYATRVDVLTVFAGYPIAVELYGDNTVHAATQVMYDGYYIYIKALLAPAARVWPYQVSRISVGSYEISFNKYYGELQAHLYKYYGDLNFHHFSQQMGDTAAEEVLRVDTKGVEEYGSWNLSMSSAMVLNSLANDIRIRKLPPVAQDVLFSEFDEHPAQRLIVALPIDSSYPPIDQQILPIHLQPDKEWQLRVLGEK